MEMETCGECPFCHRSSYHPSDIKFRWCPACGFYDEVFSAELVALAERCPHCATPPIGRETSGYAALRPFSR